MKPLLSIENLRVAFLSDGQKSEALHGISLDIGRGETLALVGESGSGKSVTALSILQLLPQASISYDEGKILWYGKQDMVQDLLTLDESSLRNIRGQHISMIFQEPMTSLNPVKTCGEQVAEAIRRHQKTDRKSARQRVVDLFSKVRLPEPEALFDRYPHQLSGGQRQRVMIAMAIQASPALLIADEPTTALDVTVQRTILDLLKDLQRESGMSLLFITHDLGVVGQVADKVAVMYQGNVVETGITADVLAHPTHPYTKALLSCRPSAHARGERLPSVAEILSGNNMIASVQVPQAKTSERYDDLKPLVEVEDLQVWFPRQKNLFGKAKDYTRAVNGVSFQIRPGEILGLVGESGCGKSTLGRTLLGLQPTTSGKISIKGQRVEDRNPVAWLKLRREVQVVFQDPFSSLNPRITIGDAILEPMSVHGMHANGRRRREKVMELLEKVDLRSEHYRRYPHEFSGGQRQRIGIARALALEPDFIVFDESVSALDVSVQAQVLNLINDLKREFGFTALFISHDLGVVRYLSDRIMVMERGQIVEEGPAEQVFLHPTQEYTRKLISAIPS